MLRHLRHLRPLLLPILPPVVALATAGNATAGLREISEAARFLFDSAPVLSPLPGPLQAVEQVVERVGDLPEHIVLAQRRAGAVIAVGDAHMRLQDLLDVHIELALLLRQRVFQRCDLLRSFGAA